MKPISSRFLKLLCSYFDFGLISVTSDSRKCWDTSGDLRVEDIGCDGDSLAGCSAIIYIQYCRFSFQLLYKVTQIQLASELLLITN